MTAQEIIQALSDASGVPFAYECWDVPPPFPFGVLIDNGEGVLFADNARYRANQKWRVELYDAIPNDNAENAIQSWLAAHFPAYLKERETYETETRTILLTSYEFTVR